MKHVGQASLATVIALTLVACGGGDAGTGSTSTGGTTNSGGTTSTATAEGVYAGTASGGTGSSFEAVILENGDVWSLYGLNSGSTFYVYGFIQGNGSSSNGAFTANTIKDFGATPALTGSLAATYSATAKTLNGTVSYTNGVKATFSGGPITGASYDYNAAPSLTAVAGHWTLTSLQGDGVSLNVNSNGTFTTLSTGGCTGSGSFTPRSSGKNILNISITFGPYPCALPNQSASGIAITYPLSTGQTQLIAAVTDSAHTLGTAVFGVR
jgi:hypothetical protein